VSEFTDVMQGYDEVTPTQGLVSEPLAKGWYWLKAKVMNKDLTKSGLPRVRFMFHALDLDTGEPLKGKVAFIDWYLGASKTTGRDPDKKDRTPEEYAKALSSVQGQCKGLFEKAMKVPKGAPTGEGADQVFNFFNVDAANDRDLVAEVTVDAEGRNGLRSYHPVDDEKRGLAWLRAKGAKTSTPTAAAATF
jgi:hypothetical protein